ncbi:MAG TPA: hypothetical protein VHH36_03940 [Candidatus Thermoplasmatota archaeon]|nr:hypothetical protein [Candidatus Thermoplasmatota archaeon]
MRAVLTLLVVALAAGLAGCTAGAGTSNFELRPERVGWFAGEEARFTLEITPSLLERSPTFTIDRRFAIEEISFEEKGVSFGGDYDTKDPDAVGLRLARGNQTADEFTLTPDEPRIDVYVTLPSDLRDSEYYLELKLFKVGWIESGAFRVDRI